MNITRHWISIIAFMLALLPAAQASASPAIPETPSKKAGSPSALMDLIEQGNYQKALNLFQQLKQGQKNDPGLEILHIQALMGLHQNMAAARIAMREAPANPKMPEFRILAGLCAYRMGYFQQALGQWRVALSAPSGEVSAYHLSIQALLSAGEEQQALAMLNQALDKQAPPAETLADDGVELHCSSTKFSSYLGRLLKDNPPDRSYFSAQAAIIKAAHNSPLYQPHLPSPLPVKIKLEEKNEQMDIPLVGGGDLQVSGNAHLSTSSSVVVPVQIGPFKKRWMVLDSGSTIVMINESTAQKMNIKDLAPGQYSGLGNSQTKNSHWVLIPEMKVGSVAFKNVPAMVISSNSDFWNKRGILPLSLFDRWALLYDRRHSQLKLFPSGTSPEKVMGKGTFQAYSRWQHGLPFIRTTLHGHSGLYCMLDTGANFTLIAGEHIRELGIKVNSGKYNSSADYGVAGIIQSGIAEHVNIKIRGAHFNLPTVRVMKLGMGGRLFPVYGDVGRDILDLFKVYFDYHRDVVAFNSYDK